MWRSRREGGTISSAIVRPSASLREKPKRPFSGRVELTIQPDASATMTRSIAASRCCAQPLPAPSSFGPFGRLALSCAGAP